MFVRYAPGGKNSIAFKSNPNPELHNRFSYYEVLSALRRRLRAGWEPVTCATASGEEVLLERFGRGETVYFVVMSELDREQPSVVTLDLESLGLAAGKLAVEEVARAAPVKLQAEGKTARVQVKLAPFRTQILKLSRSS